MQRRIQKFLGIVVLVLAAGCTTGAGIAADLPRPKTFHSIDPSTSQGSRYPDEILIPMLQIPDGLIVAREPRSRTSRQLDAAIARAFSPLPGSAWFGLLFVL
jgi:hypothetical protein